MATFIGSNTVNDVAATRGGIENDIILGLGGSDILYGGAGADQMFGSNGNDVFSYEQSGEAGGHGKFDFIDGGSGIDRIDVFDSIELQNATFQSIEAINYREAGVDQIFVTIQANQIGTNLIATNAQIDGSAAIDVLQINMGLAVTIDLRSFNFTSWTPNASLFSGDRVQINGDASAEQIRGSLRGDYLEGADGSDLLAGYDGNDFLVGGTGNDSLFGGLGNDQMSGSSGVDRFYFNTALNGVTNVDVINDFAASIDEIYLSRSVFTTIGPNGLLAAGAFRLGANALDATDRIMYNAATGDLFYDRDGAGGAAKVLFAELDPGLGVTASDFVVFA
jgi:serralysin